MLRTLFLQAPSFDGFDGGAGSRYQAKREIRSFWFPTWLAQPAALVPGSRVLDAPADQLCVAECLQIAGGLPLESIAGLSFRGPDGRIIHNAPRMTIEDMDALPFVAPVYKRDLKIE